MKFLYIGCSVLSIILFLGFGLSNSATHIDSTSISDVLSLLGEPAPNQINAEIENVSAEIGKEIVLQGFSKGLGKTSKKQSKHFVCTSCHNVVKEDPNLSISDPESRLDYTVAKGIPFLQGTTLYGAVNRTTFYNGDYEKQYGELVDEARFDIRKAIQLCATECAQGRELKDWELESILSYLWTLDLKLEDLNLSSSEYDQILDAVATGKPNKDLADLIQSKYLKGSPASFTYPPTDRTVGYESVTGNANNGQRIYEQSCLHCHENQRYSYLHLDNSRLSMKWLNKKAGKYSRHSIYQVVRYGVNSFSGKQSYMPKYPMEKMSDQQVEDLRAYFRQGAS